MRWRRHQVLVSNHAWERWQERSGSKISRAKLAKLMHARLNEAIWVGMQTDPTGGAWIPVKRWLYAHVALTGHVWVVTTFATRKMLSQKAVI